MRRASLIAVVAVAALGGFAGRGTAAPRQTWIIEVSELGFNPNVCQLSRGDQVFFKNVGSGPRHIVGTFSNGTTFYDSGEIAPGTTSTLGFSGFDFPNHWMFSDTLNSSLTGVAITPVNSNTQNPVCTVDPALRPAPGATVPFRCATAVACVHVGAVAADQ